MLSDPTSDFLTRIRNAGMSRLLKVDTWDSRMNRNISNILAAEGYIKDFKQITDAKGKKNLRLYLKYEDGDLAKPIIQGIQRASKPGLRKYFESKSLPKVMNGFGVAVISTSKGVLTDRNARKEGVGGEHICSVW